MFVAWCKSYIASSAVIIGLSVGGVVNAAGATGAPATITVSSGNSQSALVGTALPSPFVALVTDSNNNPVPNTTVVWAVSSGGGSFPVSSTVTDSNGLASNTLTVGTAAGWNQTTATLSKGTQTNFGATAKPGPAQTIGLYSGNQQSGTPGSTLPNQLEVICHDQYGNPSASTKVDWAVVSGGGSVSAESPTVGGVAVKNMTLGGSPGVSRVAATIAGTTTSYTFTETTVAGAPTIGPPSQIAIVSGNDQAGTVATTLPSPFVALVTDSNNNPVPGATVVWAITGGGGSLPVGSTVTNSSGLASNTMTLGTTAGWDKATATTSMGANVNFGATANPGPAQSIGLYSGNQQTGTVGSALPNSLEVICSDMYGNPSAATQVDWATGSGGDSFPYSTSHSVGGIATHPLTLGTVPGTDTATATIDGTNLSYTFTETAIPGPVSALVITSGNNQVDNPAGILANPFTVEATDVYGNPVSGVQVVWTATTAGDSLSVGSATTAASGLASSTLTLGSSFGLHRATATVSGTNITQTFVATEGVDSVVSAQYSATPQYVPPYFMGLSYERNMITDPLFNAQNLSLVALFTNLGPGVLRIVGDGLPNPVPWDPTGPGLQYNTVAPPDIARLAAFAQAVNWKVLYGLPLLNSTAADDASEAAVVAQDFGSNLLGFEIGNEPDLYSNVMYGTPPVAQIPDYTWQDYISTTPVDSSSGALLPSWPAFASAILAAVPNAPLTGPTGGFSWAVDFAESSVSPEVSLLTRHYYALPPSPTPPTMAQLLTPDPTVPVQFPELAQAAAAANIPGGYRISECNSYGSTASAPGVTNGFGAALWTIDFLFESLLYNSTGVNFNGGGSDQTSYSPIYDNGSSVTGIGPDYYGLLAAYPLITAGQELLTTQVTPAPSTFSAYAVVEANGTTKFILSNKDPINSITVSVVGPVSSSSADSLLLTAPSLTATTGFTLGGNPIKLDGSWVYASKPALPVVGKVAVVTIPPGSAQIVHLK